MKWVVQYSSKAEAGLQDIPHVISLRITTKIQGWCDNGNPMKFAKALRGTATGLFRFRIGDYRVIFSRTESGELQILLVVKIGHRKDIYED